MLFPLDLLCPPLALNIDGRLYFVEIVKHLFREWPPAATAPMKKSRPIMAFWLADFVSPKIASMLVIVLDVDFVDQVGVDESAKD